MASYIYALCDPRTDEIRYVGKTFNPKARLYGHKNDKSQNYKNHWLANLAKNGFMPEMEILEVFDSDEGWEEAERFWIEYLRFIGCRLTNLDGGGKSGYRKSKESIAKVVLAKTGVKASQKMRESRLGKIVPPEVGAKISASKKGKWNGGPLKERVKSEPKPRPKHTEETDAGRTSRRASPESNCVSDCSD